LRTVAQIVSVIFHPLLLATYLVAILGFYFPVMLSISPRNFKIILGFVFCFTFILPVVNIIMFRYFGTISTFSMSSRRERIIPFLAITIIYVVMVFLFYNKLPISQNFNKLMALVASLVILSTIITFFYKVSIHSLAASGLIGIMLPLNKAIENNALLWPTAWVLLISGLIMSARLYLNAHTFNEVLTGAMAGFIVGFAGMLIMF
jgi:membrane-associated phospholipid phosphatase